MHPITIITLRDKESPEGFDEVATYIISGHVSDETAKEKAVAKFNKDGLLVASYNKHYGADSENGPSADDLPVMLDLTTLDAIFDVHVRHEEAI